MYIYITLHNIILISINSVAWDLSTPKFIALNSTGFNFYTSNARKSPTSRLKDRYPLPISQLQKGGIFHLHLAVFNTKNWVPFWGPILGSHGATKIGSPLKMRAVDMNNFLFESLKWQHFCLVENNHFQDGLQKNPIPRVPNSLSLSHFEQDVGAHQNAHQICPENRRVFLRS